jgi:hypothetical protein
MDAVVKIVVSSTRGKYSKSRNRSFFEDRDGFVVVDTYNFHHCKDVFAVF